MDTPGGSNGGRDFPLEREEGRLGRGRSSGRGSSGDRDQIGLPVGGGSAELIGTETSAVSDFGEPVVPTWGGSAPSANAPERCKFLRTIASDGKLSEPGLEAVPTHRCAAFGDPLPLSLRQQELVCLQRVHVSCPRYMRGTLLAEESAAATDESSNRVGFPYLMVAGLAMVALAGVVLIASFLGLVPGVGTGTAPTSPDLAVVSDSPSPSVSPSAVPSITSSPTARPTPTATPRATPSPSPSATATPVPTPTPTPPWPTGATASRMNLVVPCVNQAKCYVYTVRSAAENGSTVNDNISGIARFFGVKVADIYVLSPWAQSGIEPGDQLKIPPPTR